MRARIDPALAMHSTARASGYWIDRAQQTISPDATLVVEVRRRCPEDVGKMKPARCMQQCFAGRSLHRRACSDILKSCFASPRKHIVVSARRSAAGFFYQPVSSEIRADTQTRIRVEAQVETSAEITGWTR
jgi:hypothetical protein